MKIRAVTDQLDDGFPATNKQPPQGVPRSRSRRTRGQPVSSLTAPPGLNHERTTIPPSSEAETGLHWRENPDAFNVFR